MKAVFRPGQPSVFSGGIFEGIFILSEEYPFEPPQFNFTTEVLNPGVNDVGLVCCCSVEILKTDRWIPSVNIWRLAKEIGQKIFLILLPVRVAYSHCQRWRKTILKVTVGVEGLDEEELLHGFDLIPLRNEEVHNSPSVVSERLPSS